MASIDNIENVHRRELLRCAVVEHYRTRCRFDGPELKRLTPNGLDAPSVRRIAKEYYVNRGILSTKDATGKKIAGRDDHADWLAKRLNDEAKKWPDKLIDRATRCTEVAKHASKMKHTNGKLASAMTKLIWFLKPDGWTMFDELAANGLGIPEKKSIDRMPLFFLALSDRGFTDDASAINEALNANGFGELFGERVIDKFLMFSGNTVVQTSESISTCETFLHSLSKEQCRKLDTTARQISKTFAGTLLHQ